MIFNKKEREVEEMVIGHLKVVEKILQQFKDMIDYYLERRDLEDKVFKEKARSIDNLEHQADEAKREIENRLFEGAFLPIHREDYVVLVDRIDEIANKTEDVADLMVLTRPRIPEFLVGDFRRIIEATVETFVPVMKLIQTFREDIDRVMEDVKTISRKEQEVDQILWDMVKKLFKSDLDLCEKLHLREVMVSIADISDLIEDAADRFRMMVIKRKM